MLKFSHDSKKVISLSAIYILLLTISYQGHAQEFSIKKRRSADRIGSSLRSDVIRLYIDIHKKQDHELLNRINHQSPWRQSSASADFDKSPLVTVAARFKVKRSHKSLVPSLINSELALSAICGCTLSDWVDENSVVHFQATTRKAFNTITSENSLRLYGKGELTHPPYFEAVFDKFGLKFNSGKIMWATHQLAHTFNEAFQYAHILTFYTPLPNEEIEVFSVSFLVAHKKFGFVEKTALGLLIKENVKKTAQEVRLLGEGH